MQTSFTLDNIDDAAIALLEVTGNRKVIAFHAEMGMGKTTFINAICKAAGVISNVSSPTFSIINEYACADGNKIYHMDLYRLKDEAEAMNAGVEDCLYSGNLCLVEWPEKAPGLFPPETVHCHLKQGRANERNLRINL
jgi:tRNA threonylcarbamoyladenosine biosynthesis protein TsaE